MIPISDSVGVRRLFPIVNILLIVANVLVFLFELSLGDGLDQFMTDYGVVPAAIAAGHPLSQTAPSPIYLTLITSQFLHGGFLHIAGNMVFLWVFGDNIEDRLGHLPYLAFYLASGVIAGLAQVIVDPSSTVPGVGASGAIAGVLAGYLVLFPTASVRTLLFIGPFITVTRIAAFLLIGFWFVLQLISGVLEIANTAASQNGGVAFWAHIGGFAFGLVVMLLLRASTDVENPSPA
ncbi:MAG TPA: rhomboid family intramembrane serine protease [Chloroflexota bacterium]